VEDKDGPVEGTFPFPAMRPHQDEAADAITAALDDGARLLLSAPTGIGKTAAAVYGAARHQAITGDRLFYVTARTTHQLVVMDTYAKMVEAGWGLRAIRIAAKGRICPVPDGVCPSCPRMNAYRRKGSGDALAKQAERSIILPRHVLKASDECGGLCPYEVSLDASMSCSVVVCDYNYVFHPTVFIQRYFSGHYDDMVLVADEAHNLRDRAMDAFSPVLSRALVDDVIKRCRDRREPVFSRLAEAWGEVGTVLDSVYLDPERWYRPEDAFLVELDDERFHLVAMAVTEAMEEYFRLPRKRRLKGERRDKLADAFSTLLHFHIVLDQAGDEFTYIYRREEDTFQIVCLDPSRVLSRRISGFHAAVGMSATLEPMRFFRDVLGFPKDCRTLSLPSPFPRENRLVRVVPGPSTRYRDRNESAQRVADTITAVAQNARGNAVAYFPSFAYMDLVRGHLTVPPDRELVVQRSGMRDLERTLLLERMKQERNLLLLGVLGGTLSEGIDLPGKALAASVVVGPALPKVCLVQELVKRHFDHKTGFGFAYAFAYPGMNKVIQAAGRVIRTPEDVGTVVLVGERFAQPFYARMMPPHWFDRRADELCTDDINEDLSTFWGGHGPPEGELLITPAGTA